MKTYLTATTLFTPGTPVDHGVIVIESGVIERVGSRQEVEIPSAAKHFDYGDAIIAPGFIDIHIHGGSGHDVMEGSASALAAVEKLLAKHGVTSYCPTTVTAPVDVTLKALEKLGKAVSCSEGNSQDGEMRARPIGVHLEGPFISKEKCGVHPLADIQNPTEELFRRFWEASEETLLVMTIAPELEGALPVIELAKKKGVLVSMGHSDAKSEEGKAGIAAGARSATHTFNAMRPLRHRDPGILGLVLTDDRIFADIVADGVHVAPEIVKLFLAAKGEDHAILITDALSATGMPDGKYKLGTFDIEVRGALCTNGHTIAGSVLTMDAAVRNVMAFAGWDLARSVRLATENPARALGRENKKGILAAGCDADLVVLRRDGKVMKTVVGGVGA